MQKSCLYDNYIDEKVIICTNTKKITGILDKITRKNIDGVRTISMHQEETPNHSYVYTSDLPLFQVIIDYSKKTQTMFFLFYFAKNKYLNNDVMSCIYEFLKRDYLLIL